MTNNDAQLHKKHRERLRERFRLTGLEGFSEHEVLELLLTYAIPQKDVNPLAHRLIDRFGSLPNVLRADYGQLISTDGLGPYSATFFSLLGQLEVYVGRLRLGERVKLSNAIEAGRYCATYLQNKQVECFMMLSLDAQLRLQRAEILHEGTPEAVSVYIRKAMNAALRTQASYVVFAHNHPSGVLEPSPDDIVTTQRLIDTLGAVDVVVADHLIVANGHYLSLRAREKGAIRDSAPTGLRFADPQGEEWYA